MSFSQLVLETLDEYRVIGDASHHAINMAMRYFTAGIKDTDKIFTQPIEHGWLLNVRGDKIYVFPNYFIGMMDPGDSDYVVFNDQYNFINRSTNRVNNPKGVIDNRKIKKAIENWEMLKSVSPDTKSSFEDLLGTIS
jgi:hypothetical protein